jgi:thiamine biosynthesis lipoprotein
MGGTARVVVGGGSDTLLDSAQARIAELESRWSRFIPTSEISQLNAHRGLPLLVSADTYLLIECACMGWRLTHGAFDPSVLDAMTQLGYDETFSKVRQRMFTTPVATTERAPGCGGIALDSIVGTITLPRETGFDPGGIGKGLAADLVSRELCDAGAAGALVSLGGDLRVRGRSPRGDQDWRIAVEDPDDASTIVAELDIVDGGVATTSTTSRTWTRGGRSVHHVIDPRTGAPTSSSVRAVTVAAADAWSAEVFAKAALVAGEGAIDLLERAGLQGVVVTDTGAVEVAA